MPRLRIGLAQLNPCVGDLAGNAELITDSVAAAAAGGAHVVVFGEMSLTGYPVEDLALRESFATASARELGALAARLADRGHGEVAAVVGYLDRDEAGPRNAAAVLHGGEVVARYFKHHLPNYGVFDERRYFVPGSHLPVLRLHGLDIGLAICEDLWQDGGPVAALAAVGVDLVLTPNASPYERRKDDARLPIAARRAVEVGAPLVYTNLVGGQDDLVFDGGSFVVDSGGALLARAPQFRSHLLLHDIEVSGSDRKRHSGTRVRGFTVTRHQLGETPPREAGTSPYQQSTTSEPLKEKAQIWSALVTGLRDYIRKNGFRSVIFGFSGGIDSAVTASLAVDAVGPDAVYGVAMPSEYSSEHSRSDAAELARRTGAHFTERPVAELIEPFVTSLGLSGLAEENIQARVRGMVLMALSNAEGHLVLAPGNKTELAVGYSTIYGDAVGGFAPIKDVPKTMVWELARWRNDEASRRGETPPIPEGSITKPPSAELRPGQLDADSLPDYAELDAVLEGYIEGNRGRGELIAEGFSAELIDRVTGMVDRAEYKRRQYPPGTKITFMAFGRDRRHPMTNAWREHHY